MAEIVLFHSVLGITPGTRSAAARLEAAGHTVHLPALYEGGRTFDDYEPAMRYVDDEIGYAALAARSQQAVEDLPAGLVYAGFSNGAAAAEYLAATRTGARGALLFHGPLPIEIYAQFGSELIELWPATVPVQLHQTEADPFREPEAINAFVASVRASGASCEVFDYPGTGHLFADESRPDEYDQESAELMWSRVLTFLERL